MVDCRPAGAPPHDIQHPPNGTPQDNHHNQAGASGDMGAHVQNSGRASTPASTAAAYPAGGVPACAYTCGKPMVWCPPRPPYAPPPPPPGVNAHSPRSAHPQGHDLPMNDLATLRYFYNVGVECVWAAYGPPPPAPYRDDGSRVHHLVHDMQQMSMSGAHEHKHKDKQPPPKTAQRPLLGPRFKRNNQDGGQNNHQNKHNTQNNKGPNNRYQSRAPEGRYEEPLEPPLLSLPYVYPPPVYPVPYYPIDADPAMMGMMGGMGYVPYDEGVEYMPPLYPPYPPVLHVPTHPHPHAPHLPHPAHSAPHPPPQLPQHPEHK